MYHYGYDDLTAVVSKMNGLVKRRLLYGAGIKSFVPVSDGLFYFLFCLCLRMLQAQTKKDKGKYLFAVDHGELVISCKLPARRAA
jgi:hypothetical protein